MNTNCSILGISEDQFPQLYSSISRLLEVYGIDKIKVVIRPKFQNAAALSVFRNYLIIGQPIIAQLEPDELEGILSHEFSHIYRHDSLTAFLISIIFLTPLFFLWFTTDPSTISTTSALLIILSLIFCIYGFKVRNWIILNRELMADREAVIKTKNPQALQRALIKLTMQPLYSKERPGIIRTIVGCVFWIIEYFFGLEHPHLKERIEYLDFANRLIINAQT